MGTTSTMVLFLIALLILSAFFSAAETAFSSVNKLRLQQYVKEERPGSKRALFIAEHFDEALSTILVGNNVVNIGAATLSGKVAVDLVGESLGLAVSTVVMTLLVLTFGEIIPKSLAKEHAEVFSLKISSTLYGIMVILQPITKQFVRLKTFVASFSNASQKRVTMTEAELKEMVAVSKNEGILDEWESKLIHRSLEFQDIVVGKIVTPRTDIVACPLDASPEDLRQLFQVSGYSRIPVYGDSIDEIVGIMYRNDFYETLLNDQSFELSSLLERPLVVYQRTTLQKLFSLMANERQAMAVVIDEFGGVVGLVTFRDLIEELLGEIWDRPQTEESFILKRDDLSFDIKGEAPLALLYQELGISHPASHSSAETVASWILAENGSLPAQEEVIAKKEFSLTIKERKGLRLETITIHHKGA